MANTVIEGRIAAEPTDGTTRAGKTWIAFVLKTAKGNIPCRIWTSSVKDAGFHKLKLDTELSVSGFYSDKPDLFSKTKEFIVKWFRLKEDEVRASEEKPCRCSEDEIRACHARLQAQGLEKVKYGEGSRWVKEDERIMIDGRWRAKIEFVMDYYGPQVVEERLKLRRPKNVQEFASMADKIDFKAYRIALEQMVEEALINSVLPMGA